MTLYLYDFLFGDMVSGVKGHGCIIWLDARRQSVCFILKLLCSIS